MNSKFSLRMGLVMILIALLQTGCGSEQSAAFQGTVEPDPTSTPIPMPTLQPLINLAERSEPNGPIYSIAWSPDGKMLVSTGFKLLKLWDAQTHTELATLEGHSSFVWGVAWAPDGKTFASASRDGTVRIWDAVSYQELTVLSAGEAFCVAWSPDGQQLVSGTTSGKVTIWNINSGEASQNWRGNSLIISVVWSPDGGTIAAGQWDGKILLWDVKTGQQLPTLIGTEARSDVNGMAWSPDGFILASAHQDGKIRLWDVENNTLLLTIESHDGWERGITWSPDGHMLASAGDDALLRIWDAGSGALLSKARANFSPLWSAAWSPDGTEIAVGSGKYDEPHDNGTLIIWGIPILEN